MSVLNLFISAWKAFSDWRRRERAYDELMALDDHSLADIGIHRSEIRGLVEGLRMPGLSAPTSPSPNRESSPGEGSLIGLRPNRIQMGASAPIVISDREPRAQHQGRPSVDHEPAFEHDAAAAMRCEHDRLLPAQQSRQHGPSAGSQRAGKIARHQRQRARQDVRQDQVVTRFAHRPIAVSRRLGEPAPGSRRRCARRCVGRRVPRRDRCRWPAPGGAAISPQRSREFRCRYRYRAAGETDGAAPDVRAPSGSRGSTDARRSRTRLPHRPRSRSRRTAHRPR